MGFVVFIETWKTYQPDEGIITSYSFSDMLQIYILLQLDDDGNNNNRNKNKNNEKNKNENENFILNLCVVPPNIAHVSQIHG
jgi:hypothetical protein